MPRLGNGKITAGKGSSQMPQPKAGRSRARTSTPTPRTVKEVYSNTGKQAKPINKPVPGNLS